MATKPGGRRRKARLSDVEVATAPKITAPTELNNSSSAAANEVEIKRECIDEEDLADEPDIKPDLADLNKELLSEANALMQLHQSVLPTFYIISKLPRNCVANTTAAAAAAAAATVVDTTTSMAGRDTLANKTPLPAVEANSSAARSTVPTTNKFLDDPGARDVIDLQVSDSDEDGYSDIHFDDDDDELVEDDDEPDLYDPQWTDQPTAPRMVSNFLTPPQNIGLQGRPKCLEPSFYVEKILGSQNEFFKRITSSSNARAQQEMSANKGAQIYFKDINIDEMKVFVGICLQMSTMKLRTLGEYWNEQGTWGFKGFGGKMSLSRFLMIMRALNFDHLTMGMAAENSATTVSTNHTSDDGDDNLRNVQPLIDFFNIRMQNIYSTGQRLVLNDPIIFWKGRFNWFSDLSDKFRVNSVMLHMVTEYTGLIQNMLIDVERKERRANERNSRLLVEQRVGLAKQLLRTRLAKGYTVYASKFYGSYALAHELAAHKTYCTGFVDVKRYGNCKELVLNKLEPNSFATKYAGSIMMGKWRNRQKSVYFYSSDCLAIYAKETSLRTIDRRPKIIKELDWQLHWKLSEEMKEKMLTYQLCLERKELKWDKQLIIYVLNLMLFNAYILYIMNAQLGRTRFTEIHLRDTTILKNYAEFRQDFIGSLLSDVEPKASSEENEQKKKKRSPVSATPESEEEDECDDQPTPKKNAIHQNLLEVEHLPMIVPRRKGKAMKKKCRICRKGGMLTFSKLCCEVCPGMPGLCETPCFKIWHDQLKKTLEAGANIKTRVFGRSGKETIYF